jgi:chromosome segregation ATPase
VKITFYPPKEVILARLGHQLKEYQCKLDEAREELKKVEEKASESKLHNPYLDSELASAKGKVKAYEATEAAIQDKIGLLEAAEGPNFQAETEV